MKGPMPLTRRQHDALGVIQEFVRDYGYAPSLEEICFAMELSSLATVHKHLEALRDKGYIARKFNHSRSIQLLPVSESCPTCGQRYKKGRAA